MQFSLVSRCSLKNRGWFTLIGGFLIHMSLGSFYTFGNLTPYLTSYIRAKEANQSITYSRTILISTFYAIGSCCSSVLGGVLVKRAKLSLKMTTAIGCLINDLAQGLTYLTIKQSLPLTIFTYGFMAGLGLSLGYLSTLSLAMKYFQNKKGFSNAVILFGFGAGGIIMTQVQTFYINPHNYSPDETYKNEKYFSRKYDDLLDKVPDCFLLQAAIFAVLQIVGLLFVTEPREPSDSTTKTVNPDEEVTVIEASESTRLLNNDVKVNSLGVAYNDPDQGMSLKDALRSPTYYQLWFTQLTVNMAPGFVYSFSKAFGQTFIANDQFLSIVGSVCAFFNAFSRLVWGLVVDRIPFKVCFLTANTIIIVFISTYYLISFTESPALFLIWTSSIYFVSNGIHVLMPTINAKTFGQKNFTVIYGASFFVTIPSSIMSLGLTQLVDVIGFRWMFIIYLPFSFIAWCLIALFRVKNADGDDI